MIEPIVHESPKDGQHYAEFKGGNHETWFVSEGYTEPESADRSLWDFIVAIGILLDECNDDMDLVMSHVKHFNAAGVQIDA